MATFAELRKAPISFEAVQSAMKEFRPDDAEQLAVYVAEQLEQVAKQVRAAKGTFGTPFSEDGSSP